MNIYNQYIAALLAATFISIGLSSKAHSEDLLENIEPVVLEELDNTRGFRGDY